MRQFAGLNLSGAIPDETTILNFRRLLEVNELAQRFSRGSTPISGARG